MGEPIAVRVGSFAHSTLLACSKRNAERGDCPYTLTGDVRFSGD